MNGKMIPLAGGDPIPLLKSKVVIGRRPDCDIRLNFPNVSGRHCELRFDLGGWILTDLHSSNGVRVNGVKVEKKKLAPGDELAIARRHMFRIEFILENYDPTAYEDEKEEVVFAKPLLERAGLTKKRKALEFDSDVYDEDEKPKSRRHTLDD